VFIREWHTAVTVGDPAAGNITRYGFARSEASIRLTQTSRQRKPTRYEIKTPAGLEHVTNPRQKHLKPAARVTAHRARGSQETLTSRASVCPETLEIRAIESAGSGRSSRA
jgi:hypothetical protein